MDCMITAGPIPIPSPSHPVHLPFVIMQCVTDLVVIMQCVTAPAVIMQLVTAKCR